MAIACKIGWSVLTPEEWFGFTINQWFDMIVGQDIDCGGLEKTNEFIANILSRRGVITQGGNPNIWVELVSGKPVEITAFEPDPVTYRGSYYYHAVRNTLYKKIVVQSYPVKIAHWKQVS